MTERGQRVLASLNPKQQQLVLLVAEGLSNRDIAQRAHMSEQVVRNYLHIIFEKMGVNSRVEMVVFSYYHGIVECPCQARLKRIREAADASR